MHDATFVELNTQNPSFYFFQFHADEKMPFAFAGKGKPCILTPFLKTCAGLAQLVEQWNHNPRVIGPNPIPGTNF